MLVAITGSGGLIGSALTEALTSAGHEVRRVRRDTSGNLDIATLDGATAVVNLAGEPIAARLRWNEAHRRRIYDSRIHNTRLVAEAMAAAAVKPKVLVSASAVGYYGSRGDEILDEDSTNGSGFLANLCHDWEAATKPALTAGIRVAHLRTGLVLSRRGGLLPRLLLPGRLGLGARLGSGRQWMSWITLGDHVSATKRILDDDAMTGAFNLCAPAPVTNAELTASIGRALHRPAFLVVPASLLRLGLGGETAEETVLTSQRAHPEALLCAGFTFTNPGIDQALTAALATREW